MCEPTQGFLLAGVVVVVWTTLAVSGVFVHRQIYPTGFVCVYARAVAWSAQSLKGGARSYWISNSLSRDIPSWYGCRRIWIWFRKGLLSALDGYVLYKKDLLSNLFFAFACACLPDEIYRPYYGAETCIASSVGYTCSGLLAILVAWMSVMPPGHQFCRVSNQLSPSL